MFSLFGRIDRSDGQTGVHRRADGIALAQIENAGAEGKPVLSYFGFNVAAGDSDLGRAARALPNRRLPTVSVMPASSYSMLLVEAPDVAADELRAAVRWRIKDLIDFHIDDAVLDVFQMPDRARISANRMMYAVAAKADRVQGEVEAVEDAGLKLTAIDILELSLRNLATRLETEGRGVGLLYLGETSGVLLIVRQGTLYLARRFETGVRTLNDASAMRSEVVAGLALEARRSLDYFESHYEQSAVPAIYTSGLTATDIDQMTAELGLSIRNFDLGTLFETSVDYDDELCRRCLPAIGAALRHEQVAL